jgi:hypothetical protein
MGRYITTTGTAGSTLRNVNSASLTAFQATVNDRILVNTTTAAVTITLPVSATVLDNDTLQIIDVGGNAGTNNITVLRNGALIQGQADNLTIDLGGSITTMIFCGSAIGWVLASV